MADIVSKEKRSRMMAGIKGKDTKPELIIRKGLFARGFRYSLHNKNLAGKPDLYFKKYNTILFVNGCFWHGHDDCYLFRFPKSRVDFWKTKIGGNKNRDCKNLDKLLYEGYRVALVWECALKGVYRLDYELVLDMLERFLKQSPIRDNYIEIRSNYLDSCVATTQGYVVSRC